ncbi:NADH-ubiquinone dehydrogenase [Aquibium carbonis]|uniref:NADH-ubiquinone dehydrogenase n=2 Tax=Aquibium carbonis TaxID=2495581 RepID=A0A3R9Y7M4_9HYPH|nr:NADH-ubiquinone dehydrogenase [Aquibium carbonis]
MDAKFQQLGRDFSAALPLPFGADAEAVKRNIATSAAMAALGAGMAGHAFGVWLSAVSTSMDVAQRLSGLATGHLSPEVQAPDAADGVAEPAGAEPVANAAGPTAPLGIERPDAPDDLKAIGGIGPKLERVLNGLGIWTYAQIAGLGEGEVLWLDEHLGFRGRIARDEWLKQAAVLAGAKA